MSKPFVVGITGGIGGGKSMFSRYLMRRGELVYDTDLEARILQNHHPKLIERIKNEFGEQIYNEYGLNRSELATIVFNDPERLQTLTNLVHPIVKQDFLRWKEEHSDRKLLFMECAVLFEGDFDDYVDYILVVTAPEDVRIQRVMKRDGVSEASVRARIKNQFAEEDKIDWADGVYDTNNEHAPHLRVDQFLEILYQSFTQ